MFSGVNTNLGVEGHQGVNPPTSPPDKSSTVPRFELRGFDDCTDTFIFQAPIFKLNFGLRIGVKNNNSAVKCTSFFLNNIYGLHTANKCHEMISTIEPRAFAVACPKSWNSLPRDLRVPGITHHSQVFYTPPVVNCFKVESDAALCTSQLVYLVTSIVVVVE